MQIASEVAQGSGAGRFQKVKVQVTGEVPEGFGADTVPCEVLEGSMQIPGEVVEVSRADSHIVGEVQVFRKVPESSGADALELDAL